MYIFICPCVSLDCKSDKTSCLIMLPSVLGNLVKTLVLPFSDFKDQTIYRLIQKVISRLIKNENDC